MKSTHRMLRRVSLPALATLLTASLIGLGGATPAQAAIYTGIGWNSPNAYMYYSNLPDYVAEHVTAARYDWNGKARTTLHLTDRLYTANKVEAVNDRSAGWNGLYTRYDNRFRIQLNLVLIGNEYTQYWKGIRGTSAHEFGHLWNLAHDPYSVPNWSVMSTRRDREAVWAATSRDATNVNNHYY